MAMGHGQTAPLGLLRLKPIGPQPNRRRAAASRPLRILRGTRRQPAMLPVADLGWIFEAAGGCISKRLRHPTDGAGRRGLGDRDAQALVRDKDSNPAREAGHH